MCSLMADCHLLLWSLQARGQFLRGAQFREMLKTLCISMLAVAGKFVTRTIRSFVNGDRSDSKTSSWGQFRIWS